MLFPISHDNATSRRWPVVTILFLAICLAVQIFTSVTERARDAAVRDALLRADQYFKENPGLTVPAMQDDAGRPLPPLEILRGIPESRPEIVDPEEREQQETLDAMVREAIATHASGPAYRFGFIPGAGRPFTLVTYAFLHGGWLHLIFNAWFLWLCGCNMEDRWGRAFYAGFYVVAGAVAALAHQAITGGGGVPLIGASGAVAGAMGAFLVVHGRARIRFFAWIFLRPSFFTAPAYVMLPLWLGIEVLEANIGVQDGVAHMAHIGGFAFGVLAALGVRLSGLEKRLDDAVERTVTVSQDPRLIEAGALVDAGRATEALAMLDGLAADQSAQIDVQLEILRAAKAAGDAGREIRAYARLIDLYVKADLPSTAMDLYLEVKQLGRAHELPAQDRLFAADRLARKGQSEDAAILYAGIYDRGIHDATAVRAVLGHARVAAGLGRTDEARRLLQQARAGLGAEGPFRRPGAPNVNAASGPPELAALIERELSRLG